MQSQLRWLQFHPCLCIPLYSYTGHWDIHRGLCTRRVPKVSGEWNPKRNLGAEIFENLFMLFHGIHFSWTFWSSGFFSTKINLYFNSLLSWTFLCSLILFKWMIVIPAELIKTDCTSSQFWPSWLPLGWADGLLTYPKEKHGCNRQSPVTNGH